MFFKMGETKEHTQCQCQFKPKDYTCNLNRAEHILL